MRYPARLARAAPGPPPWGGRFCEGGVFVVGLVGVARALPNGSVGAPAPRSGRWPTVTAYNKRQSAHLSSTSILYGLSAFTTAEWCGESLLYFGETTGSPMLRRFRGNWTSAYFSNRSRRVRVCASRETILSVSSEIISSLLSPELSKAMAPSAMLTGVEKCSGFSSAFST